MNQDIRVDIARARSKTLGKGRAMMPIQSLAKSRLLAIAKSGDAAETTRQRMGGVG